MNEIEKVNAFPEVTRYTQTPTQPMSYILGKLHILELLEEYKSVYPGIKDRELRDMLLSYGTIPITLIRDVGNKLDC